MAKPSARCRARLEKGKRAEPTPLALLPTAEKVPEGRMRGGRLQYLGVIRNGCQQHELIFEGRTTFSSTSASGQQPTLLDQFKSADIVAAVAFHRAFQQTVGLHGQRREALPLE
jgi:hypothetical protein